MPERTPRRLTRRQETAIALGTGVTLLTGGAGTLFWADRHYNSDSRKRAVGINRNVPFDSNDPIAPAIKLAPGATLPPEATTRSQERYPSKDRMTVDGALERFGATHLESFKLKNGLVIKTHVVGSPDGTERYNQEYFQAVIDKILKVGPLFAGNVGLTPEYDGLRVNMKEALKLFAGNDTVNDVTVNVVIPSPTNMPDSAIKIDRLSYSSEGVQGALSSDTWPDVADNGWLTKPAKFILVTSTSTQNGVGKQYWPEGTFTHNREQGMDLTIAEGLLEIMLTKTAGNTPRSDYDQGLLQFYANQAASIVAWDMDIPIQHPQLSYPIDMDADALLDLTAATGEDRITKLRALMDKANAQATAAEITKNSQLKEQTQNAFNQAAETDKTKSAGAKATQNQPEEIKPENPQDSIRFGGDSS